MHSDGPYGGRGGYSRRTTDGRRRQEILRRRKRRRLVPLITGAIVVLSLTAVFTASFGKSSRVSAATSSTTLAAASGAEQPVRVDPAVQAESVRANEMGKVLVLMYHLIGQTDSEYNRTPQEFRQDIADLKAAGYHPVNLCELVSGGMDVPAGKTPVVITFDDSSGGQYRILADGTLDPDCAVAIMQESVKQGDWASKASFYPLIDVDAPDRILFGQPDLAQQKLQQLVAWGYEVGSHTVSHLNLKKATQAEAKKQLYQSQRTLEDIIGGGYKVVSLAAPFGEYPSQASILKTGEHDGQAYHYLAALKAFGGAALSPFSEDFRAYHIPRIQVSGSSLSSALASFEKSPGLRYVSDGDSATVAVPAGLDPSLGSVRGDLDQEIVRY